MTKLEYLNQKLELRKQAEDLIKGGEAESRKLNSVEEAKLTELRKQMADIDAEIAKIDATLEEEKRVADTQKKSKEIRNKMENTKKFSLVEEIRSRVEKGGDMTINMPAFETRQYDVTGGKGTGDETVPTEIEGLLTPLYDNQVLSNFTILTGLNGNVKIPSMGANSVGWAGETDAASATDSSIVAVELKPKRLTAYVDVSKQLLFQSNSNIEAILRQDLQNAVADKLQLTCLGADAGDDTKPAGIFNGASATTVTFANICDIEEKVEEANAVATGYIISPKVKATARQAVKASGQGGFIFENGQLDGQPTYVTNASKGIVYGNLKDYVIGSWDNGVEITIDPYTQATKGNIRLVVNSYWDAAKRREDTIVAKTVA